MQGKQEITDNLPEKVADFILLLIDHNTSRRNAEKILFSIFALKFN